MIDKLEQAGKARAFKRFIRSPLGDAILETVAEIEVSLLEQLQEQHRLLGLDAPESLPDREDRVDALREASIASVEGRFPEWWVRNVAPVENREAAAAAADVDDFAAIKEKWAEAYRDDVELEADVENIASAHVRNAHDVDIDTFREVVVEWPDGRSRQEMHRLARGNFESAGQLLEASNDRLRELDLDGDEPDSDG